MVAPGCAALTAAATSASLRERVARRHAERRHRHHAAQPESFRGGHLVGERHCLIRRETPPRGAPDAPGTTRVPPAIEADLHQARHDPPCPLRPPERAPAPDAAGRRSGPRPRSRPRSGISSTEAGRRNARSEGDQRTAPPWVRPRSPGSRQCRSGPSPASSRMSDAGQVLVTAITVISRSVTARAGARGSRSWRGARRGSPLARPDGLLRVPSSAHHCSRHIRAANRPAWPSRRCEQSSLVSAVQRRSWRTRRRRSSASWAEIPARISSPAHRTWSRIEPAGQPQRRGPAAPLEPRNSLRRSPGRPGRASVRAGRPPPVIALTSAGTTPGLGSRTAGMRRADNAGAGIGEQDRRAVRGENAERHTWHVGEHRVCLHGGVAWTHVARAGTMHLPHPHHLVSVDAARSRDKLAVPRHRGGIITDREP